jgi:hypothetical protein
MNQPYAQSFVRRLNVKDPYLAQYLAGQQPEYHIGLDLGQAQDFSALVVISLTHQVFDERLEPFCEIPQIVRWPLGTPYPEVVRQVSERMSKAPAETSLVIDGTGCGRAVVDLFLQAPLLQSRLSQIIPVTITAGEHETYLDGYRRVPKRNLVGSVQVLLQSGRLKIAANLPETRTLVTELQNFKVKITAAANDTYEAWREGMHDDLILATALAVWNGTNIQEWRTAS